MPPVVAPAGKSVLQGEEHVRLIVTVRWQGVARTMYAADTIHCVTRIIHSLQWRPTFEDVTAIPSPSPYHTNNTLLFYHHYYYVYF